MVTHTSEANEPTVDSVDGSGVLSRSDVDVSSGCRRSSATTSIIEDLVWAGKAYFRRSTRTFTRKQSRADDQYNEVEKNYN